MVFSKSWEDKLVAHLKSSEIQFTPVFGGDINQSFLLECSGSQYFLKYQKGTNAVNMHFTELKGLEILQGKAEVNTPTPVIQIIHDQESGLIMPYIIEASTSEQFSKQLGSDLARQHQVTHDHFGLDHNNFIGNVPQLNSKRKDWPSFYTDCRILPLVRHSFDETLLHRRCISSADKLCARIGEIYPPEAPALLHGDLWSGNVLCDTSGHPFFIDPAIYYGHREMDMAMMHLFGGFNRNVDNYYHEYFPLAPGWRKRLKYGQLYYLLVHLIIFGSSYRSSVEQILSEFN